MTTIVVPDRFACRRRSAADWTAVNEVLYKGEIGVERDTRKFKFGDGVTPWNDLAYAVGGVASTGSDIGYLHVYHSGTFTTSAAVGPEKVPLDTVGQDTLGIWDAVNHEAVIAESGLYIAVFHRTTATTAVQAEALVGFNAVGAPVASRAWNDGATFYSGTMNLLSLSAGDKVWAGVFRASAVGIICAENEGFRLIGPIKSAADGDYRTHVRFVEEFMRGAQSSANTGTAFVTTPGPVGYVGAGGSLAFTGAVQAPGNIVLLSGTAANGYARLWSTGGPILGLHSGKPTAVAQRIYIDQLSNATNAYLVQAGLDSVITGAIPDAIWAKYDHAANSGKWVLEIIKSGVTHAYNTNIPVVAGALVEVRLVIDPIADTCNLYIDGEFGVTGNNIPSAFLGMSTRITKTAGTASRFVTVDYHAFSRER